MIEYSEIVKKYGTGTTAGLARLPDGIWNAFDEAMLADDWEFIDDVIKLIRERK